MNDTDTELLSKYIDGELNAIETEALEGRLAEDTELRASLASMQAINSRISHAFDGTAVAPSRVTDLLERKTGNVVAFPIRERAAGWGFAVAASLMAASGLLMFQNSGQLAGEYPQQDTRIAGLINNEASRGDGWDTLEDGSRFRAVLSFQSRSGEWCREYLLQSDSIAGRGIACRTGENWVTQVFSSQDVPGSATEYRPAGADDADAIARFMADNADNVALGAEEEARLIARDWQ